MAGSEAGIWRSTHRPSTAGDWEAWLDFFLDGVVTTATGAGDSAQRLVAVVQGRIPRAIWRFWEKEQNRFSAPRQDDVGPKLRAIDTAIRLPDR
jgi:hypothetical protein